MAAGADVRSTPRHHNSDDLGSIVLSSIAPRHAARTSFARTSMGFEEVAPGVGFILDGHFAVPTHQGASDRYRDFEDMDKLMMKRRDLGTVQ